MNNTNLRWNSFLIAVFFFESIVCTMLHSIVSIENISVFLMAVICILFLITNKSYKLKKIKDSLIFAVSIYLILLFSAFINGINYVETSIQYFTLFGIAALILLNGEFDIKFFFKCTYFISLAYLTYYVIAYRRMFLDSEEYFSTAQSIGYIFAIIIFLHLIYTKYFVTKKDKIKYSLLSVFAITVSVCGLLFDARSRGAFVSLFIYIWILVFLKENTRKRVLILVITGVAVTLLILNLETFLYLLSDLFSTVGIKFIAIDKTLYLIAGGYGMGNGRHEVFALCWDLIKQSPIVGNGIGAFEKCFGIEYPHNIFLQLLCEIGVVGTFAVTFFLGKDFFKCLFNIMKQTNVQSDSFQIGIYKIFVFFNAICYLLFSLSYWCYPPFWLYVASLLLVKDRVRLF